MIFGIFPSAHSTPQDGSQTFPEYGYRWPSVARRRFSPPAVSWWKSAMRMYVLTSSTQTGKDQRNPREVRDGQQQYQPQSVANEDQPARRTATRRPIVEVTKMKIAAISRQRCSSARTPSRDQIDRFRSALEG